MLAFHSCCYWSYLFNLYCLHHFADLVILYQEPIEVALVEALAQEHFNYIAEGGAAATATTTAGRLSSCPGKGRGLGWFGSGGEEGIGRGGWGGSFGWSPSLRAVLSVVTLAAAAVLTRHFKELLVDVAREALSVGGGEEGGDGSSGGGRGRGVRVQLER